MFQASRRAQSRDSNDGEVPQLGKNHRSSRRRRLAVGVSVVVAVAIAAGGATVTKTSGSETSHPTGAIHLTSAELQQWHTQTATPFQREEIVEKVRAAFAGVAQVGVGPRPADTGASGSVGTPGAAAAPASSSGTSIAREVLSYGVSGSDFWVVASYGDMARGAIWGADYACKYYYGVPSWLCDTAANILSSWSQGWGSASNHGVWAAVYWWPPHVAGGRW
jgi:hypothetical protein